MTVKKYSVLETHWCHLFVQEGQITFEDQNSTDPEYSTLSRGDSIDLACDVLEGLSELAARVREMPHVLKAGDGDVIKSLSKLVDLVEHGNGLRQLQVWSRFAWVFGRANTEHADHCLSKLLEFALIRKQNADLLRTLPKWSFRARAKALRYALKASTHCEVLLDHLNDNEHEARALERAHNEQSAREAKGMKQ